MGRIITFIYGLVLAIAVLASWFGFLPDLFLPFLVIAMGVLIFFTPLVSPPMLGRGFARPRFQWLRRYLFGVYLVLAGLMSYVDVYTNFPYLARTSIYTFSGQCIILGIALIYFLAAFERTRNIQVGSY